MSDTSNIEWTDATTSRGESARRTERDADSLLVPRNHRSTDCFCCCYTIGSTAPHFLALSCRRLSLDRHDPMYRPVADNTRSIHRIHPANIRVPPVEPARHHACGATHVVAARRDRQDRSQTCGAHRRDDTFCIFHRGRCDAVARLGSRGTTTNRVWPFGGARQSLAPPLSDLTSNLDTHTCGRLRAIDQRRIQLVAEWPSISSIALYPCLSF